MTPPVAGKLFHGVRPCAPRRFFWGQMGDDELDEASKLKIAANFINYSPPGQIQKVVEDVKVLLGGHVPRSTLDSLMVKVNSTSFLAVDVPGEGRKVLITPFGDLGDGTFLDPMGLQRLTIDHGKQVCTSAEALSGAEAASLDAPEKGQVDAAMTRYAANKLPDAVVTTYCKVVGTATQITCCIGRWGRWLKGGPLPLSRHRPVPPPGQPGGPCRASPHTARQPPRGAPGGHRALI